MKKSIKMGIVSLMLCLFLTGCGKSHAADSIKEYSVTFDTAGGNVIQSQIVADGSKVTMPSEPTKEGYTFNGWYLNGKVFDFKTTITSDTKLEARWIKGDTYTVTFNDGESTTTKAVAVNGVVSAPTEPTKEGYIFSGWYNGNNKYDFASKVTKDITLTAKWEKVGSTSNQNNSGTTNKTNSNTNKNNSGNKNNLNNNNSTNNSGNNSNSSKNDNSSNVVPTDSNKIVSFKVEHYKMNLSGGYDVPFEVENQTTLNNYVVIPKVKNYVGFTSPKVQSVTVIDGANTVVRYYYQRNKYTVNVLGDSGLKVFGSGSYYYESVVNISASALDGYTFNGWDNGNMDNSFTYTVGLENVIFKANSLAHKYTVKFDANGGTGVMDNEDFVYGTSSKLLKNEFSKKYVLTYDIDGTKQVSEEVENTFKGWSTTKDGSEEIYSDLSNVSNLTPIDGGEVTLYAQWNNPIVKLNKDFKRSGYRLIGWSVDGSNVITNPDSFEVTEDTVLHGVWEVIPILENISFGSICSDADCNNPIDLDITRSGEDTFYLRIPVGTYIDLNSISFNFNTEVELNYDVTTDNNYLEFIPSASNRVSLGSNIFQLVTTDNKHYRNFIPNKTNIYEISDFITLLNGRNMGVVAGFAKDSNGELTEKYVSTTFKKNGVWYIVFSKENAKKVTITYKNSDKEIGKIELPIGSVMPEVGRYEIIGYDFNGWYTLDSENNKVSVDYTKVLDSDLVIYGDYSLRDDFDTSWYDSDSSKDVYSLTNYKELNGLNKLLNEGIDFSNKTIELANDIDLENKEWTPIKGFKGTFDGKNYTISNLKMTNYTENSGFFGSIEGATIKNLKFDGVDISNPSAEGVGVLAGTANKVNISNIYVTNIVNLVGKTKVGGLIGEMLDSTTTSTISECMVENGTITAYSGYIGGIVGLSKGKKNNYSDIIVNVDLNNLGGTFSYMGGIIGYHEGKSLNLNNLISTGMLKSAASSPVDKLYGIYSASNTPIISNLYYINGTGKGEMKSEDELKSAATYGGFDDTIWNIVDGSYPTLKWINK